MRRRKFAIFKVIWWEKKTKPVIDKRCKKNIGDGKWGDILKGGQGVERSWV